MSRSICIYLGLIGIAAVAALTISTGHGRNPLNYWPYLVILACPLMHIFMHRRHSRHGHRASTAADNTAKASSGI